MYNHQMAAVLLERHSKDRIESPIFSNSERIQREETDWCRSSNSLVSNVFLEIKLFE